MIEIVRYKKFGDPDGGEGYNVRFIIDGLDSSCNIYPVVMVETDGVWDEQKAVDWLNSNHDDLFSQAKGRFTKENRELGFERLSVLLKESPGVNVYIEYDVVTGDVSSLYFDVDDVPGGATYTLKAMSLDCASRVYANPGNYYIDVGSVDKDLYKYA